MEDYSSNTSGKYLSVSPEQLERLRRAPRSPEVWQQLGVRIADTSIVVVERDRVRIVRAA